MRPITTWAGVFCLAMLSGCGDPDPEISEGDRYLELSERFKTASRYVIVHDYMDVLRESECGYLVHSSAYGETARREILPYLTKQEAQAVTRVGAREAVARERAAKNVSRNLSEASDKEAACRRAVERAEGLLASGTANWTKMKAGLPRLAEAPP